MAPARPRLDVAVIMQRVANTGVASRWQPWRWQLAEVLLNQESFGSAPRCLRNSPQDVRWLYPGFEVELFKDDAEGYYLNVSSPSPCWFVLWRMHDGVDGEEALARPEIVSLSYHDAGRWLDAQETVEQVPAPTEVIELLQDFVAQHYVPEPKRRKRPESFRRLADRFGNPASISTGRDKPGDGHG